MRRGPSGQGGVEGQLEVGGVLGRRVALDRRARGRRPRPAPPATTESKSPTTRSIAQAERLGVVDARSRPRSRGVPVGSVRRGGRGSTGSPPVITTTMSLALGAAIEPIPSAGITRFRFLGRWRAVAGGHPLSPATPSSPSCARQGSGSAQRPVPALEPLHRREAEGAVDPQHRLVAARRSTSAPISTSGRSSREPQVVDRLHPRAEPVAAVVGAHAGVALEDDPRPAWSGRYSSLSPTSSPVASWRTPTFHQLLVGGGAGRLDRAQLLDGVGAPRPRPRSAGASFITSRAWMKSRASSSVGHGTS